MSFHSRDPDPDSSRGPKRYHRYQGPQPPEVSSTPVPDNPFEERVRSVTLTIAMDYCIHGVLHQTRLNEGIGDVVRYPGLRSPEQTAIEPHVRNQVKRFFDMAALAHAMVIDGTRHEFPSTRIAVHVQHRDEEGNRRDITWFIFDGHQQARRLKVVKVLCENMEAVNRAGSNIICLNGSGIMAFRACGNEPPDEQIKMLVRRGECTLDRAVLGSLSSSGCALHWKLPAYMEGQERVDESKFNTDFTQYHGDIMEFRATSYTDFHRPFYDPAVLSGNEPKLMALGYLKVHAQGRVGFVSTRIASADMEVRQAKGTVLSGIPSQCTRPEAEMRALACFEYGDDLVPVVFAYGGLWVAFLDIKLRREVTAWYIHDTEHLGIKEIADLVASHI